MAAIWQQKVEAKEAILATMEQYFRQHPERRHTIVADLCRSMMSRMTLRELTEWRARLERLNE